MSSELPKKPVLFHSRKTTCPLGEYAHSQGKGIVTCKYEMESRAEVWNLEGPRHRAL